MLSELIEHYKAAQSAWLDVSHKDESGPSTEWDAYEAAEDAVLSFPCTTIEEVRLKAAFVKSDENAFDSVKNCFRGGDHKKEYVLAIFLRSLLGSAD